MGIVSILVIFIVVWNKLRPLKSAGLESSATSSDSQQFVRRCVIRKQLAPFLGHAEHIFILHSETPRNINQRLESANHSSRERLVSIPSHIGFFVKLKPDAVAHKADRLKSKLAEFFEERIIDRFALCSGPDHIHHEIFALDQVGPDFLLLRGRRADHRRAANAREVSVLLSKNFHPDEIALV